MEWAEKAVKTTKKNPNPRPLVKRVVIGIIFGVLGLIFLFTLFYQVGTNEVGVVTRFGKHINTTQPGLHAKVPYGIDRVIKVPIRTVQKEEFGFRTVKAGVRTEYVGKALEESLMLSGDLNSAVVDWTVQYRISDPVAYLYKVRNVKSIIRDASETVMRQVVGDRSVDEVIILSRREVSLAVQEQLQEILDYYEAGINVVTVELKDVNPPDPVKPAFNEVNEAKQEQERMVNEAWEAYNQVIPKASGEAEKTIRQAEGYALNRINRAQGDANRFLSVWKEYSLSEDVTRRRLYLETLNEVLPEIGRKYIVDSDQQGLVPLLRLEEQGGQK
jgi:membrane protease subunit HflK